MHFKHLSYNNPYIYIYHKVHSGNGKGQNLEGIGYFMHKKLYQILILFSIKNILCITYKKKLN